MPGLQVQEGEEVEEVEVERQYRGLTARVCVEEVKTEEQNMIKIRSTLDGR